MQHTSVESWLNEAIRRLDEGHDLLPADQSTEDGPCYGFADQHDEQDPHHVITIKAFRDTSPHFPWPDRFNQAWSAIRRPHTPKGREAAFIELAGDRATRDDNILPWARGAYPEAAAVYKVENTHPERFGYGGFMSYWIFNDQGHLIGIGHYE